MAPAPVEEAAVDAMGRFGGSKRPQRGLGYASIALPMDELSE